MQISNPSGRYAYRHAFRCKSRFNPGPITSPRSKRRLSEQKSKRKKEIKITGLRVTECTPKLGGATALAVRNIVPLHSRLSRDFGARVGVVTRIAMRMIGREPNEWRMSLMELRDRRISCDGSDPYLGRAPESFAFALSESNSCEQGRTSPCPCVRRRGVCQYEPEQGSDHAV